MSELAERIDAEVRDEEMLWFEPESEWSYENERVVVAEDQESDDFRVLRVTADSGSVTSIESDEIVELVFGEKYKPNLILCLLGLKPELQEVFLRYSNGEQILLTLSSEEAQEFYTLVCTMGGLGEE